MTLMVAKKRLETAAGTAPFFQVAKKRLETAAGIAPFFQICKKKKGLETAAGIAPFFSVFCALLKIFAKRRLATAIAPFCQFFVHF